VDDLPNWQFIFPDFGGMRNWKSSAPKFVLTIHIATVPSVALFSWSAALEAACFQEESRRSEGMGLPLK
jgi:hypothetical protein